MIGRRAAAWPPPDGRSPTATASGPTGAPPPGPPISSSGSPGLSRHESAHHRRSRLHRVAPRRGAARRRAPRVGARQPVDRARFENIDAPEGPHPGSSTPSTAVDNEPLLAELIDDSDVVFHLAAAVGVKLIVEEPVHTIETNVHGTEVVLKHANKKKKLVVIASTSEVYGKSTAVPVPRGRGPRARARRPSIAGPTRAARRSTSSWRWRTGRRRSCRSSSSRFFNTVGPRQTGQYGMVIPNFVRQALAGRDHHRVRRRHAVAQLHPRRRRRRRRSLKLVEEPRAVGQVFNIGNSEEIYDHRRWPSGCASCTRIADRPSSLDPVRPGLRVGLRGHAAARAGSHEDPRARRLRPPAGSRRDPDAT